MIMKSPENVQKFCFEVLEICREKALNPPTTEGLAYLIELGARMAESESEIFFNATFLCDLLVEANFV
jgi:hypothetical protein